LMLFGLAKGVNTMKDALGAERTTLIDQDGLDGDGFSFPTNGSGSPDSAANPLTVVKLLTFMSGQPTFTPYFESLPILGVDGSLAEIGVDSPAKGNVHAKTGTFIDGDEIKAQVLAGFIDARSGRRLVYALFVNNVGKFNGFADILGVVQDLGQISTIIYQLN
jgi:D-alanyl-D-alanine carboxypeptidase